MYLESLKLERFRSFEKGEVYFDPLVTVLVGENNGGKSNVIEALRLLTPPITNRRDRYCEDTDLRLSATEKNFKITARLDGLTPTQKGLLLPALIDPTKNEAVIGLTCDLTGIRSKSSCWAGPHEIVPESGTLEHVKHIYLPPLRDAQKALSSGDGKRIESLLNYFRGTTSKEDLVTDLQRAGTPKPILTSISTAVGTLLKELTVGVREQDVSLEFSEEKLIDIARDLKFRLADAGLKPQELAASGLGIANLLFMTTVMVELEKAKEADLTLFLVEEPEAHLHPQLQMLVLEMLKERAAKSIQPATTNAPEGRIQVIVTTHSPNLTAWVEPKHLVILKSCKVEGSLQKVSHSVAIRKLGIDKDSLDKVSRYLDVTRSSLLFGGKVLIVEGIAEALLLPVFAEKHLKANNPDGWKKFRATTLISIDGVDFKPYLKLLLTAGSEGIRIADKLVIITDRDPKLADRKKSLENFAGTLNAKSFLKICMNTITLEYDIYTATNAPTLTKAYKQVHPRSQKWDKQILSKPFTDQAKAFHQLFNSKHILKGDFAQQLAAQIVKGEPWETPAYILEAINEIVAA